MDGYVYILRSIRNRRFYIGSTDNIERRLKEHKEGMCHTTKRFLPVELVLYQKYDSLTRARDIELRLKRMKRKDIIQRIVNEGKILLT